MSINIPPSEKESGVTFNTPIIRVFFPTTIFLEGNDNAFTVWLLKIRERIRFEIALRPNGWLLSFSEIFSSSLAVPNRSKSDCSVLPVITFLWTAASVPTESAVCLIILQGAGGRCDIFSMINFPFLLSSSRHSVSAPIF